ncbi:MAG: hypothetical protein OXC40_02285 [Proteobacteria bacterium]|nr:hypothetical protein [Pseudomonadota bacterium]
MIYSQPTLMAWLTNNKEKAICFCVVLVTYFISTENLYGLVGGGLQLGYSHQVTVEPQSDQLSHMKNQVYSMDFIQLRVHASPPIPIPFTDIAFGVVGSYENYHLQWPAFSATTNKGDPLTGRLEKLDGYFVGPEISISSSFPGIPLGPIVRGHYAFARLNQAASLQDKNNTWQDINIPLDGRGFRYAVGIHYSPMPFLSLFAEYEWSQDTISLSQSIKEESSGNQDSYRVSDNVNISHIKFDLKRRGFAFGVKAGI